ncbi:MAG: hypothetical protein ABI877_00640 [Gemmatimonadaceae bacterium]
MSGTVLSPFGAPASSYPTEFEDPPISILGLANASLQSRHIVLRVAIGLALVVGVASLLRAPTYTSTLAFAPQSRRSASNLAGLAAQFGFNLPSSDATQVPQFYSDLLVSYTVLGAIVDAKYDVQTDTGRARGDLVMLLNAKGKTPALAREEAIRRLRTSISVTPVQKTGVVRVDVHSSSPELAQQIGKEAMTEVNRFNLLSRSSQASAERQFTEQRLREAEKDLRGAEDVLRRFRMGNRTISGSPLLELEADRMDREVTQHQQVVTALNTAYEQARIEEVRDTPVITIVEAPVLPVQRDSRGTVTKALVAFVLGLVLACFFVWARRRLAAATFDELVDERVEFHALARQTLRDFRRPWRLLVAPSRVR